MFASLRKSVGVNVDRARYYFFIVFKAYLAGDLSEVVSATLEKNLTLTTKGCRGRGLKYISKSWVLRNMFSWRQRFLLHDDAVDQNKNTKKACRKTACWAHLP